MKSNEFIIEEIVSEYSEIHDDIRSVLEKKGYKFLGKGADQAAFLEPGTGQVLKIFGTSRQTGGGGVTRTSDSQKMFEVFEHYCKQHSGNPFLPKFSGFKRFVFDNHTYYQIRQEKLSDSDRDFRMDLWTLTSMITTFQGDSADHVIKNFVNEDPDTCYAISNRLGAANFKLLVATVLDLYNIGEKNGYRLDLHDENYMMRGKNPVIVDPWVHSR